MPYGTIKVDNITFTDNSVDKTVSLSGLIQNPTFTGNVTVTGTISGDVIRGGTTISGVTVTGTTANFVSGLFTAQVSGTTIVATTGTFFSLAGTTTTGTTANFVSGVFTSLTGVTTTVTSGIFGAGSATAPSVAVGTGTTYKPGIYSPGADQLAISTNGTGRLFVDASGNIGVGVISPQHPVHIDGTSGSVQFRAGVTYAGTGLDIKATENNDVTIDVNDSTKTVARALVVSQAGSERLRITSAGLVGIGTSLPGYTLDVTGTHRNSGIYFNSNDTPQGTAGTISRNSVVGLVSRGITGSVFDWSVYSAGGTALISNTTGTNKTSFPGGEVYFTGGNVGIGTTGPSETLHVNGNARLGTTAQIFYANNIACLSSSADTTIDASSAQLIFKSGGGEAARLDASKRLLVGTSSTSGNGCLIQARNDSTGLAVEAQRSSDNASAPAMFFTKSRGTQGSPTEVSSGDQLGVIAFSGYDGAGYKDAAYIIAECDGTWTDGGDTTDNPGRLVFSTTADGVASPTERMQIGNKGKVIFTCVDSSNVDAIAVNVNSTNGSQYGITVATANDQNNTGTHFFRGMGGATERFTARTNGGLANIQANNVNLSDLNTKKDISPAADTWNYVKEWEIVNYLYKDQPDDTDLNLGVIAQQVAESCPEVITVFQEAKEATEDAPAQEERLGVKEQQMYWMAIKALQEAIARIETLEAEVAALKGA